MVNQYFQQCVLYPDDLAVLQRVFDEVCADGCLEAKSLDGHMIASVLLGLFQNGLTDEAALLAEMRSRRQHLFLRAAG